MESPSLLPPCSIIIITIALHNTIILIITLTSFYIYIYNDTIQVQAPTPWPSFNWQNDDAGSGSGYTNDDREEPFLNGTCKSMGYTLYEWPAILSQEGMG